MATFDPNSKNATITDAMSVVKDAPPEKLEQLVKDAIAGTPQVFKKYMNQQELRTLGTLSVDITELNVTNAIPLDYIKRIQWDTKDNARGSVWLNYVGRKRYDAVSLTGVVRLKMKTDSLHQTSRIEWDLTRLEAYKVIFVRVTDPINNSVIIIETKTIKTLVFTKPTSNKGYVTVDNETYNGNVQLIVTAAKYKCINLAYRWQYEGYTTPLLSDRTATVLPKSFINNVKETIKRRQAIYASPSENHELTRLLYDTWLTYRQKHAPQHSTNQTPEDICVFNILQKLSRLGNGTHDDSWLDVIGWAENVAMLNENQRNKKH